MRYAIRDYGVSYIIGSNITITTVIIRTVQNKDGYSEMSPSLRLLARGGRSPLRREEVRQLTAHHQSPNFPLVVTMGVRTPSHRRRIPTSLTTNP